MVKGETTFSNFICACTCICIMHEIPLVECVLLILYCWLTAGSLSGAGPMKNPWLCGLCNFRCSTRSEVLDHTWGVHGLKSQFKCGLCSYRSSSKASFDSHFASKHPAAGNVELIHVYRKVCNSLCKLKTGCMQTAFNLSWNVASEFQLLMYFEPLSLGKYTHIWVVYYYFQ